MKKLKLIFLALVVSVSACGQKTDSTYSSLLPSLVKSTSDVVPIDDSLMFKTLGDSIYDIIMNAKTVEVSLTPPLDSTSSDVKASQKLDTKQIAVAKFLVSDPKNYTSNATVFGQFLPSISFTFSVKKKECIIKFDFGLRKHCVYDKDGNELKTFDLQSSEMLRLAHVLYPENEFFVKLLNYNHK